VNEPRLCPCCGARAKLKHWTMLSVEDHPRLSYVECTMCGLSTRYVRPRYNERGERMNDKADEDAIAAWNRSYPTCTLEVTTCDSSCFSTGRQVVSAALLHDLYNKEFKHP
jgi:Zn ribbon nucleic-acid-binding protein